MKITKAQLKRLIKEELDEIAAYKPPSGIPSIANLFKDPNVYENAQDILSKAEEYVTYDRAMGGFGGAGGGGGATPTITVRAFEAALRMAAAGGELEGLEPPLRYTPREEVEAYRRERDIASNIFKGLAPGETRPKPPSSLGGAPADLSGRDTYDPPRDPLVY